MEDPAVYQAAPAADRRDLVAPVAAWLVGLGFQVECGPREPGVDEADVQAGWQCPGGSYFFLLLLARPDRVRCEFSCSGPGAVREVLSAWRWVNDLPQVQAVLVQNCRFSREVAAAGLALPPAGGSSAVVVPAQEAAASPAPASAG